MNYVNVESCKENICSKLVCFLCVQIFQANAEQRTRGYFYPPTLVVGAQMASRIVYEEVS
jgi:hypothetical protein